ncbi:MAG: glycosyl transferase family 1 [Pirellula sp.]|nr:glycosyl transferase family 1 [Pirellula sp.]
MTVLHIYSGNLYGGIEAYLATLARLRDLVPEMHPEFALCFAGRLRNELQEAGVPVYDLGSVRMSRPWTVFKARRRLQSILARRRPDAVVVHGSWSHAVFGPVVKQSGCKLIHALHDDLSHRGIFDRMAARCSPNVIIANSKFTSQAVRDLFQAPVEVVFYPVAPVPEISHEVRTRIRDKHETSPDSVVILQACRLERWKGQSVLIRALARLHTNERWELWLVGGPQRKHEQQYFDELRQMATDAGICHRVRFVGQSSEVRELMASADIYCQPNTGPEPFGIVFVEALLAGLPIITASIGGAAEIVDATCGVAVTPGSDVELASILEQLIEDPIRRRMLSQGGPARAEYLCGPKRQMQQLADVIEAV